MTAKAEMRDVVRAFDVEGPRGGRELVHVLSCGCWLINRRKTPLKRARCIACRVCDDPPPPVREAVLKDTCIGCGQTIHPGEAVTDWEEGALHANGCPGREAGA